MQLFSKKFSTEVFQYYSDTDINELKKFMQETFEEHLNSRNSFSARMIGNFTIGYQFQVMPGFRIVTFRRKATPTTIDGQLIPFAGKTEVKFRLSPIPFRLSLFASIVLGLFGFYHFIDTRDVTVLLAALVLLFLFPNLLLALVAYEKRKLKEAFISTFNLIPKDILDLAAC